MKKPETIMSYVAGALFAIAWWLWIDATVFTNCDCPRGDPDIVKVEWYHYMPGVVSTVALVMINVVSWNDLNGGAMFGESVSARARVWLFFSFLVAFGGLIGK
eukprot:TRINITY_DN11631_c0_g1_i1.p1 TRINITY_DN11631_c0_g1~~TRINITY_DN11631_c0_g1_i1.p1  ORF type:complete len:103 (-),score=8.28 TRINITY_DN11631_c0_g1_i1:231-539(-)